MLVSRTLGVWIMAVSLAAPGRASAEPPAAAAGLPPEVAGWFQQAGERFAASDYEGALVLLERACSRWPFEGCSLNLGAVHHALRHCAEARRHYGDYLREAPAGERSGEARAALGELEQRCVERGDAAAPLGAASEAMTPDEVVPTSAGSAVSAEVSPAVGPRVTPGASPLATAAAPLVTDLAVAAPGEALGSGAAPLSRAEAASASSGLDREPRHRAVAASLLVLGGVAGVTTAYLGVQLAKANAEVEEHKGQPFDRAQEDRYDRASDYRVLTWGAGAATVGLLGAGGLIWWYGSEPSPDVQVSPLGLQGVQLRGRF